MGSAVSLQKCEGAGQSRAASKKENVFQTIPGDSPNDLPFDRVAYMREYMRKWRKRKKDKQT
jgi:hypothetical protein